MALYYSAAINRQCLRRTMKQRIAVLLMLGMLPWAGLYAQSQTATTTFVVKARVQAVCAVTATDLDFGTYNAKDASPQVGYDAAAGNLHAGLDLQHRPQRGHDDRRDDQCSGQ